MDKEILKAAFKAKFPDVATAADPQDKLCEILADVMIQHLKDYGVVKVDGKEGTIE